MFQWPPSDHATLVIHLYLLGGDVLATIAVGIGILWEAEAISVSHKVAGWLVLWGVVLETVCSIALFTFDEGISHAQQSTIEAQQDKIIELETRLADRQLSDSQLAVMAEKLSRFAGQEWDVTPYWDSREPLALANRIHSALDLAHWKYVKPAQSSFLLGGVSGVQVYVHPEAAPETKDAAIALVGALNTEHIDAQERLQNDPGHPSNMIHMNVGTKP